MEISQSRTEKSCRINTYSVDTSPLLEEHSDGGNDDSLEHGLGLEKGGNGHKLELEDVQGSLLLEVRERLGNSALLKQRLCLDFEKFKLNELVVSWQVAERSEVVAGLLFTVVVHQPTWGERHPDHSDEENERWDELEADRDEPCCV